MKFSSYIFVITYIITAVGFASICLIEEIGFFFKALSGFLIVLSIPVRRSERISINQTLWTVISLGAFVFFIADYLFVSGNVLGAGARFLSTLAVIKLYGLKTNRDHVILYSIVFFQLIAAAASTVSPLFFAVLAVFTITAIWGMVVLNMQRDYEEKSNATTPIPKNLFGSRFFTITVLITITSILITFMLFFFIPRIGIGFFKPKTLNTIKMTGFSDTIFLGALGPVKKDSTIIMRVSLPSITDTGRRPSGFYFRGSALDRYDGTEWTKTSSKKSLLVKDGSGGFRVPKRPRASTVRRSALLEQRIMLEPLETDVIFAVTPWVRVSGKIRHLTTDNSGTIYLPTPAYRRITYSVWSMPMAESTSSSELAPSELSRYLQLPSKLSKQVRELALSVTKEAGEGTLEKARAIERHLKTNYKYTLNPPRGEIAEPLENFLFSTKRGYCEHYATSMVIMLRTIGIPSRMVTGFLEGQWNKYGQYLQVRQQDAHTWVEVYTEDRGWTRFDPTASAGLAPFEITSTLSLYLDSLRWRWNRYIVNYSLSDQVAISIKIKSSSHSLRLELSRFLAKIKTFFRSNAASESVKANALLLLMAVIIFAAIIIFATVLFKRRDRRHVKTPLFYLEMLDVLQKKGLRKEPFETPREFARKSGVPEVLDITEAFEKNRYGSKAVNEEHVKTLLEALKKKH